MHNLMSLVPIPNQTGEGENEWQVEVQRKHWYMIGIECFKANIKWHFKIKQSSRFRPSIRMWQGGSENVSHVHSWPATNLNVWFESVWETRQHTAGRRFIQVLVLSWLLHLSDLFKTRSKSPFCLLSFLTGARDQRPDDRVARWCCAHTHTSQISSYCYMQAQNTHRYLHAHKDTNRHGRWLQDQTKVGSVSLFNLSVKSLHGTECSCYCSSTPCLLPPSPPPHPPPARLINAALRCSEKMMSPKPVLSLCF